MQTARDSVINDVNIDQIKNMYKAALQRPNAKYAQLHDNDGVYMGIVHVQLCREYHDGVCICGNGRIVDLAKPVPGYTMDSDYCKFHAFKESEGKDRPPDSIELELEFHIHSTLTHYNSLSGGKSTYDTDIKDQRKYIPWPCKITLTRDRKIDDGGYFHAYKFKSRDLWNQGYPEIHRIVDILIGKNTYVFEFQYLPVHESVPGLYFSRSIGYPSDQLAVLISERESNVDENGQRMPARTLMAQYKFDQNVRSSKIIHMALDTVMKKIERVYTYLYNNSSKSTQEPEIKGREIKTFCQHILDVITHQYTNEVAQEIQNIKTKGDDQFSASEIRDVCEFVFLNNYPYLMTSFWKTASGTSTYDPKACNIKFDEKDHTRKIAYTSIFDEMEGPDTVSVSSTHQEKLLSRKHRVFDAYSVFHAYVELQYLRVGIRPDNLPLYIQDVLSDAKKLQTSMKHLKSSSNVALKKLKLSCLKAVYFDNFFGFVTFLMLHVSTVFNSFIFARRPTTNNANFKLYHNKVEELTRGLKKLVPQANFDRPLDLRDRSITFYDFLLRVLTTQTNVLEKIEYAELHPNEPFRVQNYFELTRPKAVHFRNPPVNFKKRRSRETVEDPVVVHPRANSKKSRTRVTVRDPVVVRPHADSSHEPSPDPDRNSPPGSPRNEEGASRRDEEQAPTTTAVPSWSDVVRHGPRIPDNQTLNFSSLENFMLDDIQNFEFDSSPPLQNTDEISPEDIPQDEPDASEDNLHVTWTQTDRYKTMNDDVWGKIANNLYPLSMFHAMFWKFMGNEDISYRLNFDLLNYGIQELKDGRKLQNYFTDKNIVLHTNEKNPVKFIESYLKKVSSLVMDTINKHSIDFAEEDASLLLECIHKALELTIIQIKKMFGWDCNHKINFNFKKFRRDTDEQNSLMKILQDIHLELKRQLDTNRELETQEVDGMSEGEYIFKKHSHNEKMSLLQFKSAIEEVKKIRQDESIDIDKLLVTFRNICFRETSTTTRTWSNIVSIQEGGYSHGWGGTGRGSPAPSRGRGAGRGGPAPSRGRGAGRGGPAPSRGRGAGRGGPVSSRGRGTRSDSREPDTQNNAGRGRRTPARRTNHHNSLDPVDERGEDGDEAENGTESDNPKPDTKKGDGRGGPAPIPNYQDDGNWPTLTKLELGNDDVFSSENEDIEIDCGDLESQYADLQDNVDMSDLGVPANTQRFNVYEFIDKKTFLRLFTGNFRVSMLSEFVQIVHTHTLILIRLIANRGTVFKQDICIFGLDDDMSIQKKIDISNDSRNLEVCRLTAGQKYHEWWIDFPDSIGSIMMRLKSIIFENIVYGVDETTDMDLIRRKFLHDIDNHRCKNASDKETHGYKIKQNDFSLVVWVKCLGKYRIFRPNFNEPFNQFIEFGRDFSSDEIKYRSNQLPLEIPDKYMQKIQNFKNMFKDGTDWTVNFTVHEREIINVKFEDGTSVNVPLDPVLTIENDFTYTFRGKTVTQTFDDTNGKICVYNFVTKQWSLRYDTSLPYRICNIIQSSIGLHNALNSKDIFSATRSLSDICSKLYNKEIGELHSHIERDCYRDTNTNPVDVTFQKQDEAIYMKLKTIATNCYLKFRNTLNDFGLTKEGEEDIQIMQTNQRRMKSALNIKYPCLVTIYYMILQCMKGQKIEESVYHSVSNNINTICFPEKRDQIKREVVLKFEIYKKVNEITISEKDVIENIIYDITGIDHITTSFKSIDGKKTNLITNKTEIDKNAWTKFTVHIGVSDKENINDIISKMNSEGTKKILQFTEPKWHNIENTYIVSTDKKVQDIIINLPIELPVSEIKYTPKLERIIKWFRDLMAKKNIQFDENAIYQKSIRKNDVQGITENDRDSGSFHLSTSTMTFKTKVQENVSTIQKILQDGNTRELFTKEIKSIFGFNDEDEIHCNFGKVSVVDPNVTQQNATKKNDKTEVFDHYLKIAGEIFKIDPTKKFNVAYSYIPLMESIDTNVLESHFLLRRKNRGVLYNQHTYNPISIPNNLNKDAKCEIKMINFLIFDCAKLTTDLDYQLLFTNEDVDINTYFENRERSSQEISRRTNVTDRTYQEIKTSLNGIYGQHPDATHTIHTGNSDIIDFLQAQWSLYLNVMIRCNLHQNDPSEKFNIWKKLTIEFLRNLTHKHTEFMLNSLYLYIEPREINNMIEVLNNLTLANLDNIKLPTLSEWLKNWKDEPPVYFGQSEQTVHDFFKMQKGKVISTRPFADFYWGAHENIDGVYVNDNGLLKRCMTTELSNEQKKIAHEYGFTIDSWTNLILTSMHLQLYYFKYIKQSNAVDTETPDFLPPISELLNQLDGNFSQIHEKWKKIRYGKIKNNLETSDFTEDQVIKIVRLVGEYEKLIFQRQNIVVSLKSKMMKQFLEYRNFSKIDLQLGILEALRQSAYELCKNDEPLKQLVDSTVHAAMHNQPVPYPVCEENLFGKLKNPTNDRIIIHEHMQHIIKIFKCWYSFPEFTYDTADLKYLYQYEQTKCELHLNPVR